MVDRFREFKGKAGIKAYLDLFKEEGMIGFRQEPKIALSDGKNKVKAIFIAMPGARTSTDIAIMGARLLSLLPDPEYSNTWIAEALPEKDGYRSTLSVPQGDILMVFPLTVAPSVNIDLDGSGKITEEDFKLFLREKGTASAPRFDLNHDGKRDSLDDYIFTANYMAKVNETKVARQPVGGQSSRK